MVLLAFAAEPVDKPDARLGWVPTKHSSPARIPVAAVADRGLCPRNPDQPIGNGKPGAVTRKLLKTFRDPTLRCLCFLCVLRGQSERASSQNMPFSNLIPE